MQVALPVVPRSPAPLASRSEKELGCCVLAGIPSDDVLAPQRFLEMEGDGDTALHQLCDSRGPSPHRL